MLRYVSRLAGLTAFLVVSAGLAAAAAPVHIRGTIASVQGAKVVVKDRDGRNVSLTLGSEWRIGDITKASIADIKPGTFIGTANVASASGAKALEVVVFPDAMRGTGEGDYGWDLKPKSSMTNATVKSQVQGVDGQTLTLTYKGGQKKVTIPPDTPIVMVGPVKAADLTPGAPVFVAGAAGTTADTLEKGFIAVGKDGAAPPM